MKKRNIIITSICVGTLVIAGIVLGTILGVNSNKKRNLYDVGVKHLVDGEYQEVIEAQTITTKAHTLELIERVEPSCANETNGYLAHYKCSAC